LSDKKELLDNIRDAMYDFTPDIWDNVKESVCKKMAERLLIELSGMSDNCGKIINEKVNEVSGLRKVI
jgi:hypothetical protein